MTDQTTVQTDAQTRDTGSVSHADRLSSPPEGGHTGEPHNDAEEQPAQKANKEARYRVERNQAREELAASNARVELLQTRELERIAGSAISNPADLLALTNKTVADFLDDSGELDAELVAEAASELLSTRPRLGKNAPAFDPTHGSGGSAPKQAADWSGFTKTPY